MAERTLRWETVASTIAYECPGFVIRRDTVTLPDGTQTSFDYLEDNESVVVIPFTPDNDLVVIEEWRQAVNRVNQGFPAGESEPSDATITATAHRELTEETGYVADGLTHLVTVEPANGITNAIHHYFIGHDCRKHAEPDLDPNESITVGTTDIDHLRTQIKAGKINDGRTVLGVLYYDFMNE